MSYSLEIINNTDYIIKGEISYSGLFSPFHYFFLQPHSSWESQRRKLWPIILISAIVRTPAGIFKTKSFFSVVSGHHVFEVVNVKKNTFRIIRRRVHQTSTYENPTQSTEKPIG